MVVFDDVTKVYRSGLRKVTVLDHQTVVMPADRNIGILGRNGSGKSTLLRMIAGAELPTSGAIWQTIRVSWPLGFAGSFPGTLTGIDNIRFVARIYNRDWRDVFDFVEEFSELGNALNTPLSTYSSGMRARLAFGLSMAIDFDCYLIDEITAVGDRRFSEKCEAEFKRRREKSNVIMVSHNPQSIKKMCDVAYILEGGELIYYEDMEEALDVYRRT